MKSSAQSQSTSDLRAILDHLPNGVIVLEPVLNQAGIVADFLVTFANQRAVTMLRHDDSTLLGASLSDIFPGNHTTHLFDQCVMVMQADNSIEYNFSHQTDEGVHWCHACFSPIDQGCLLTFKDITKQQVSRQAEKEDHFTLDRFFSLALNMLCIADANGTFLRVNDAWENALGYSIEELEGIRFLDLVHPDDLESTSAAIEALVAQTPIANFTNRYRHKDGSYRFIKWQSYPDGDLIYAVAEDVTGERELEMYRSRLVAIVEATHNAIIGLTQDGIITSWNPAAQRIYGYTSREMIGQSIFSLVPPQQVDELITNLEVLSLGYNLNRHETVRTRKDGSLVDIAITLSPIRDQQGSVVGISSIHQDITEFKHAQDALRDSEQRFRTISSIISDYAYSLGVFTGGRMVLEWVAGAFTALTGYTHEELLAAGGWGAIIHPDDVQIAMDRSQRLMSGKDDTSEFRIITRSGQVRWLRDYGHPVRDEETGQIVRILGAAQDISARKEAEQQLFQLRLEQERSRMVQKFIEQSSHEFRTPISIIQSRLYLMNRIDDAEKRLQKARSIEYQLQRIISLVDMLQLMNQLDMQPDLFMHPVDINQLVSDLVYQFEYSDEPHATFHFEPDAAVSTLYAAPTYLEKALRQLMDNANRFTPAEGHITVHTHQEPEYMSITIEDDGPGIPEAALPHIFERFYRLDDAHTTPGFGLGLPIARSIIEKHGGSITISSTPGQGTRVSIHLPNHSP